MWLLIIMGLLACWIISSMDNAAKDQEIANQSQAIADQSNEIARMNQQIAAKRPDAFIRLFAEEFPNLSSGLTFTRAEAAINAWERAFSSQEYTKHLALFDKSKFKDDDACTQAFTYIVYRVAEEISPEFEEYVRTTDLDTSYGAIRRVMNSSHTLAGQ